MHKQILIFMIFGNKTHWVKKKCVFPIPWQKGQLGQIKISVYFEILFLHGPFQNLSIPELFCWHFKRVSYQQ